MTTGAETADGMRNESGSDSLDRRSLLRYGLAGALSLVAGPAMAAPRIRPERSLHLVNVHTGESFRDVYWAHGRYVRPACRRIAWLMRDFHIDRTHHIDPDLLDLLHEITMRLKTRQPLQVLSGYRSPETNRALQEEGFGVSKNSMHLVGKAADITLPGVRLGYLRRAAAASRAGGVGYYPDNGFIHVDTGRVRFW
jgi:uncharacterized protein YcbK (DUF882 family)